MATQFNVDNLVINRAIRGTLFDKGSSEVIFTIDQITDPKLECGGDQVYVKDALGQNLAAFDRSKTAKFTGSNALVNFGLMAAQLGSEKTVADADNKIVVPAFEMITVTEADKVTLANTPTIGSVKYIYSTHTDKSINQTYALGGVASATEFSIAEKVISLPTSAFAIGDRVAVFYTKDSTEAVKIKDSTDAFAKGGKFVLEVLACDVCDTNTEYYTYIIFDNAKMDNAVDVTFTNEAKHGFTVNAMQDYCSASNELFSLIIAK